MAIRLYNFSFPSDLRKEINIYNTSKDIIPEIAFYKERDEFKDTIVYKKFFGIKFKKKVRSSTKSFFRCFVKNDRTMLNIISTEKGSDGKNYFKLFSDEECLLFDVVTIDERDYTSTNIKKCKVYGYPIKIELVGFPGDNWSFSFINSFEVKEFLTWVRDYIIKDKDEKLFESCTNKIFFTGRF